MFSLSTILTALAGSIILSSISIYSLVLKSISGTLLIAQSLPSVSRSLIPLLATSLASLPASCFLPRPYLTIHNLYIRFISLSSLTKSIISSKVSLLVLLLRVLPPIILKDLFNRFALKSSIIPLNPPVPQSKTFIAAP